MNTIKIRDIEIGAGAPKIIVPIVGVTKEDIIEEAKTFDSIPIDEVGKRISKLRAERSALQETIKRDLEKDDGKLSIKEAKEILKSAPQIFDFGSEDEKKRLVSKLIKKIIVNQGDIDIHWSFT